MPLALLLVGILFLVAAVRGKDKTDELFSTLKSDFTGPGNFIYWGLALFLIGALGYYRPLKPVSSAFMALVIIALFFSNKGFFQKFMEQINATQSGGGSSIVSGSGSSSDVVNGLIKSVSDQGNGLIQSVLSGVF